MKRIVLKMFPLFLIVACGKDPVVPPAPAPVPAPIPAPVDPVKPQVLVFTSKGKSVTIEGFLKAGAKITAAEAKKQMDIASELLDKQ